MDDVATGYREKEFAFEGSVVRYLEGGSGPSVLLLHGVGPGTSCQGNYRFVLGPLAERFRVYAMDLVGFGRSGRKVAPPFFDFEFWYRQAERMLARIPAGPVCVIGHSLSGALTLRLAARNPRISRILTTGSVGTSYPVNPHLERLWTFPESRDELRDLMRVIVHDASTVTDAALDDRLAVLTAGDYREYFRSLFGGDKQHLVDSWAVAQRDLAAIDCRVTMIHGREDLPCPAEQTTLRLAAAIPQADVLLLARCGHGPALEHPQKFMMAVDGLFAGTTER
jgi:2-hydroxymuconate-semialdehyde hydrolase